MGISEQGLFKPCSVRGVTGIVKWARIGLAGSEVAHKVAVGGQRSGVGPVARTLIDDQ